MDDPRNTGWYWIALALRYRWLIVSLAAGGILAMCVGAEAAETEVWLSPGGISHHQSRDAGYRERNPGVVLEIRRGDHAALVGQYRNSFDRDSKLIGYRYTAVRWGGLSLGATIGAIDGYPYREGRWSPVALPVASYQMGPVALSLMAAPPVAKHIDGWVVAASIAVRVW